MLRSLPSQPSMAFNASPRVTTFSWVTAILEITANLVFGAIGLMILRERRTLRSAI